MAASRAVWVFHRGALGDSVLLWPMLRARARTGDDVVLVTDGSKGTLAVEELRIIACDAEQRWLNDLWVKDAPIEPVSRVDEVLVFTGNPPAESEHVWVANLRRCFVGADVHTHHGRPDARFACEWTERGGEAARRSNPSGSIVCHVGAGAEAKRWPMHRFAELAEAIRQRGNSQPMFIAGEVESERMTMPDRRQFAQCGGRFINDLQDLARLIRSASLFIGNDSGPTHLAAQMGIATIALFGPTDPDKWGPVGPAVEILAPPTPRPMTWLPTEAVVGAVARW